MPKRSPASTFWPSNRSQTIRRATRPAICDLFEGQKVQAGERFGMIRFGSRVDVYLDEGMVPMVVVGQRAIAGETVLADARANEPAREGGQR